MIGQKEAQVLSHRGYAILLLYASQPILISLGVACRMHTREIHVVLIHIVDIVAHDFVRLLRRVGHRTIDGFPFFLYRHQIITLCLTIQLAAIGRTVEKRRLAILLTVQITA